MILLYITQRAENISNVPVALEQWFSIRVIFAPKGILTMSGDPFDCHN